MRMLFGSLYFSQLPAVAFLTVVPTVDITLVVLATLILTFALGSVPWGLIISRLVFKTDIREHGSGNIGTTNAMRTLGKGGGAAVFVLDFCKGLLSGFLGLVMLWLALRFGGYAMGLGEIFAYADGNKALDVPFYQVTLFGLVLGSIRVAAQFFVAVALFGCVLGHIFSPWLKFKGGKGIAVAIGCVFVTMGWLAAVLELTLFAVLVLTTRYVSIGSIAAAAACPFFALWVFWGNAYAIVPCAITGLVIIWAHRGNLKRLFKGTEPRIGAKKTET